MLGIWIEDLIQINIYSLILSWFLVFVLLLVLHFRQNRIFSRETYFTGMMFLLSFMTGIWLHNRADERKNPQHYLNYLQSDKPVSLKLLLQKKKRTTSRQNFTARVKQLNGQTCIGKILVHIPLSVNGTGVGDEILVYTDSGAIYQTRKARNPYAFDYRSYLQRQNIYREINLKNQAFRIDSTRHNLYQSVEKIRQNIKNYLASGGLSPRELAFANTILLGERHEISQETYRDFQSAGTMHILAISGLHVGILLVFLNLLLYPLKRFSLFLFLLATIGFLWFYALLSGFSPSVVRAVLMFSLLQTGFHIKRQNNTYNIVFITAFLMLLYKPDYLFQVGFQMSFLAVLSILSFLPFLRKLFHSKYKLLQWWLDLFSVSLSAQLGILPVSLYYFHQFPLYFWLANLLVVPLLFLDLFIGFTLLILSFLHIKIEILFKLFGFLTDLLMRINHKIGEFAYALIQHISFGWHQMLISLIFIFVLYHYLKKPAQYYRLVALFLLIIFFQASILYENYQTSRREYYYIMYQYHSPLVAMGRGDSLHFYRTKEQINPYVLNNMELHYKQISFDSLAIFQQFQGKKILHIDSLGIYAYNNYQPDIVVMHRSPKINFERMLLRLHPKLVVADASNRYSLIEKWKQSARKYRVEFYDINQKGAWVLPDINEK